MQSRHFVIIAIGILVAVSLQWATAALGGAFVPETGQDVPRWYALTAGVLHTLAGVLPALLAGFFARRRGALVGASVGLLGALAVSAIFNVNWQSLAGTGAVDAGQFALQLLALSLGPAIVGFVSGAAGEHFASRRAI